MRKSILNLLGSMILAIPMLFSSCGNGDNALEEIINGNTTVSGLADAVKDGAEVTLDLALLAGEECPVKVYFKKEGNSFTFLKKIKVDNTDYDWSEVADEDLEAYVASNTAEHDGGPLLVVFGLLMDGTIEFTHDTATNQLKFLLKVESGGATTRASAVYPLLAVNFDVNKNTFSQFSYPFVVSVFFKGISVDGVDKSSQIKSSYDKKASVYFAGTTPPALLLLYIFYNEGETWTDLNKRYKEEGGYDLLKTAEEIGFGGGFNKSDLFMMYWTGPASFLYKEETPTVVSGSHKAGYKADGSTVNEDGYMITVLTMPLG